MGDIIKLTPKKTCSEDKNNCCKIKDNKCWCPKSKWYMKDGCPFVNKNECDNYKEMCGKR